MDEPVTVSQYVYQTLRTQLIEGVIAPGTRLTQTNVANQLSVSTTPVREAFRRLSTEGFIQIDAYRGAVVRGLQRSDLEEIYLLRSRLEPLALERSIPNITAANLNIARTELHKMDTVDDVDAWVQSNRRFHESLTMDAELPHLRNILEGLRASATPYVRLSIMMNKTVPERANREHHELMMACEAGDIKLATKIEERHLEETLAAILNRESSSAQ